MGLDISLYRCDVPAREMGAHDDKCDEIEEAVYSEFKDRDYEERKAIRQERMREYATANGISTDGDYRLGEDEIQEPSATDPEHMFKVGYFRSSYNDGGINSVANRLGVPGLYEIFPEANDGYMVVPDWEAAMARCDAAIASWEERVAEFGGHRVLRVAGLVFGDQAASEEAATNAMLAETKRWADGDLPFGGGSYSKSAGTYYPDGVTVRGIVVGLDKRTFQNGVPTAWVLIDSTDGDGYGWYVTAMKIVRETIEHVLASGEPQMYRLHWSS